MKNIEVNSTIQHKTENVSAVVLAISHVKQNACIKFEDGFIQMIDLTEIESNYNVK